MSRFSLAAIVLFSTAITFAQTSPVPFIDQPLVPTSIAPGSSAFSLTVHGANFVVGSVVRWNGHSRPTQFVSLAELIAGISADDVLSPGVATIAVVNPGSSVPTSNIIDFSITSPFSIGFSSRGPSTRDEPGSIGVGDLNADGHLDLISDGNNGIYVSFGSADGKFRAPLLYPIGATWSVRLADFNGGRCSHFGSERQHFHRRAAE